MIAIIDDGALVCDMSMLFVRYADHLDLHGHSLTLHVALPITADQASDAARPSWSNRPPARCVRRPARPRRVRPGWPRRVPTGRPAAGQAAIAGVCSWIRSKIRSNDSPTRAKVRQHTHEVDSDPADAVRRRAADAAALARGRVAALRFTIGERGHDRG